MRCPHCGEADSRVLDTMHEVQEGGIRRRRECLKCGRRFSTIERVALSGPMIVKRDGRREPFDRNKLLVGIQISCSKRPIPGETLERLVDNIESKVHATGKAEVSAKFVGDLVMAGLKDLDHVAYIRYAIVYLGLADIEAVRREIDRLLEK